MIEDIQDNMSQVAENTGNWLTKSASRIIRLYSRMPIWGKILFWLAILMAIHLVGPWGSGGRTWMGAGAGIEGFGVNVDDGTGGRDFVTKRGLDVYDAFYASVYDDLVYDAKKVRFELAEIQRATNMDTTTAVVLDIGSGTGHHCGALNASGYDVTGLDQSTAMVARAQKRFPGLDFRVGDATAAMTFPPESFTHILCLYFTIYYIEDKPAFFQNCYNWLKPGGYLALHLVNRNKFDPIIAAANPLTMVSPQKYAKERITKSVVKFRDAQYRAEFDYRPAEDYAEFDETFKSDATGHVRKNEHQLFMPSQRAILEMAQNAGFNLLGKIDMVVCQYEYQYIYLLYRPM